MSMKVDMRSCSLIVTVAMLVLAGCERQDEGGEHTALPPDYLEKPLVSQSPPATTRRADPDAALPPPGVVNRDYKLQQTVQPGIGPRIGVNPNDEAEPTSSGERYPDPPAPSRLEVKRESSQPGYTLLTFTRESRAVLLDHDGQIVHNWATPDARHWDHAEILPDCDLIVTGSFPAETERPIPDDSRMLMRLDWDSAVRWRADITAHGNVVRAPDGRLTVLTLEDRLIEQVHEAVHVRDDVLTFLTPGGEVVERISLYDIVADSPTRFELLPSEPKVFLPRKWIDVLRANWIDWIDDAKLAARNPLYAPTNLVVTCQDQDRVMIVNTETRKVEWSWGQHELQSVHGANMLANGNVLLFDNGINRRYSRILEVDPTTSEIIWEYSAKRNRAFFSFGRGSCQRLSNGNTLICNSDPGEVLEVTASGDIVWRLFTAEDSQEDGRRRPLANAVRYDPETVQTWMNRAAAHD